jgi:hypothetical protein
MLEQKGYTVLAAATAERALELFICAPAKSALLRCLCFLESRFTLAVNRLLACKGLFNLSSRCATFEYGLNLAKQLGCGTGNNLAVQGAAIFGGTADPDHSNTRPHRICVFCQTDCRLRVLR